MSKKRTLKYKTIAKSEEAPVVGSVVEEKDTIFVKQITATEFELYASDEKGNVIRLKEYVNNDSSVLSLSQNINSNVSYLRNMVNYAKTTAREVEVVFRADTEVADIKVMKSNGVVYNLKLTKGKTAPYSYNPEVKGKHSIYLDEGDRVYVDGSTVESGYIVANGVVYGSNISGEKEVPVSDRLYIGKIEGSVNENDGHIFIGKETGSLSISINDRSLSKGHNIIEKGSVKIDYSGARHGSYVIKDGKGAVVHRISSNDSGSVTLELNDVFYISAESFAA